MLSEDGKLEQKLTFKYIQFAMKPSLDKEGKVKFITEYQENDRPLTLNYRKFLAFLLDNFKINDKVKLIEELDCHQIVFLDNTTGNFQTISMYENAFDADFKTLAELNTPKPQENIIDKTNEAIRERVSRFKGAVRHPFSR